jgi:HK97 family phage portal protein
MGTAVVDAGMKFTPISYNARDNQYLETRKFQIEEVARAFRVPPHMLMLMDRATNNNIEHQSQEFVMFSLTPWLRRLEMAMETQLLTLEKSSKFSIKFDTRALMRGDLKSRGEYYGSMITNKIMTRNEVRELEDLNPVEGGDVFENPNITPGDSTNENDPASEQ